MRKLGRTQKNFLSHMADRKLARWSAGSSWHWGGRTATVRLCESLVKRGFLCKEADVYYLTPAGLEAANG